MGTEEDLMHLSRLLCKIHAKFYSELQRAPIDMSSSTSRNQSAPDVKVSVDLGISFLVGDSY